MKVFLHLLDNYGKNILSTIQELHARELNKHLSCVRSGRMDGCADRVFMVNHIAWSVSVVQGEHFLSVGSVPLFYALVVLSFKKFDYQNYNIRPVSRFLL